MENRQFYSPSESGFSAANTENPEYNSEKKETKKKKSKFVELLAKLLPKKVEAEDNSPENSEKKRGFLEKIAGRFGFLGFEKVEVPDLKETDNEKELSNQNFLYAPISVKIDEFDSQTTNEETVHSLPDSPREQIGYKDEDTPETTLQANNSQELHIVQDLEDISSIEDSIPNNPLNEVVSIQKERSFTVQGHLEAAPINPVSSEVAKHTDKEREKETIIEKGGGHGAALLGFIAADTLSRARDKKIRKEAAELKEQVKKLEEKQLHTDADLETVRLKNQEQLHKLRLKRIEAPEAIRKERMIIDTTNAKRAVEQTEETSQVLRTIERQPRMSTVTSEKIIPEKRWSSESASDIQAQPEKKLVLDQVEKAADQGIAIEAFYERRHEAKDVPTAIKTTTGTERGSGGSASVSQPSSYTNKGANLQKPFSKNNQSSSASLTIYKKAARQGAIAGLAIVLGFALVALIWSLF